MWILDLQRKYRVSNKIQVSIGIEQNLVSNQHYIGYIGSSVYFKPCLSLFSRHMLNGKIIINQKMLWIVIPLLWNYPLAMIDLVIRQKLHDLKKYYNQ